MLRKFLSIAIVITMVLSMFCGCATKVANVEQKVDFSIRYQNCVANFCRTGNPSTEDIKWEKYDKENKYCALLNSDKMECIKNFRTDRIDNMIKMVDENDAMKFFLPWNTMFKLAQDLHK